MWTYHNIIWHLLTILIESFDWGVLIDAIQFEEEICYFINVWTQTILKDVSCLSSLGMANTRV